MLKAFVGGKNRDKQDNITKDRIEWDIDRMGRWDWIVYNRAEWDRMGRNRILFDLPSTFKCLELIS